MENTNPNIARVQHVAKSSSDQLLSKFAEVDSESKHHRISAKDLRLARRAKRSGARKECDDGEGNCKSSGGNVLAERKSLLPVAAARKPAALIRRLGMSKAKNRAREIKNKSIFIAIEKTWRRTVEGASRVLMEKHYNRHKRLINDVY
ncbi:hypothetical protein BUALT_Bualt12G0005800 [Buddleja alternifolia]|uniref:Uncharacterized protein n=1 Tax=Buddleja alternifolia TaxID=168488 RepID=A0AAV6WMC9_9LAMI|nr:hypothetical protein BUALT_Bualt12G0005800 [Buddleja alternifolia]